MKNLLLVLVLVLALASCGAKSVAGKYRVKVPTGEKVTDVGELDLKSDGTFSMSTGQLKMAGQWTQEGDRVKFSPGDTAAQLLSSKEFKFEGDRLIPQGQAGPQKHWYFSRE